MDRLAERTHLKPLVASWYSNVQSRIAAGMALKWTDALESYAYALMHETTDFQDTLDEVFKLDDRLQELLEELAKADFSFNALKVGAAVCLDAFCRTCLPSAHARALAHALSLALFSPLFLVRAFPPRLSRVWLRLGGRRLCWTKCRPSSSSSGTSNASTCGSG